MSKIGKNIRVYMLYNCRPPLQQSRCLQQRLVLEPGLCGLENSGQLPQLRKLGHCSVLAEDPWKK